MIKYHVKFTHQYQLPQQSEIQYFTETVDAEWELEEWVNVFAYIYTHYNVVGDVEVTRKYEAIWRLNHDGNN